MPTPDLTLVARPPHVDKNDPRYFTIKSGAVQAITVKSATAGEPDEKWVVGIASSSVTDRYGDDIDVVAQARMVDQAKGLTMWLNHSYKIPEDILGVCPEAHLESGNDPQFGPCIDLHIKMRVYEDNPRALAAWRAVNSGVKLGFSIGAIFTDFDFKNEDDWWDWTVVVHDLDLLEISLVGIPANPRAYTKAVGTDGAALRAYVNEPVRKLHEALEARAKQAGDGAKTPDFRLSVKKSILAGAGSPEDDVIELKGVTADDLEVAATAAGVEPGALKKLLGAKLRDGSVTPELLAKAAESLKAQAAVDTRADAIKAAATLAGIQDVDAVVERIAAEFDLDVADFTQEVLDGAIEAQQIIEKAAMPVEEPSEVAPTQAPELEQAEVAPTETNDAPPNDEATSDTTSPIVGKAFLIKESLSIEPGQTLDAVLAAAIADGKAVEIKAGGDSDNDLSDDQLSIVVDAMQGIRKGYDRVHECFESMGHIRGAHMSLKELLPDSYDTPADAELPDEADQPTVEKAIAALRAAGVELSDEQAAALKTALPGPHAMTLTLKLDDELKAYFETRAAELTAQVDASIPQELRDAVAELEAKRDALTVEISTSTEQHETLTTEIQTLEQKAEELRATPTGRRSAQPGGSTKENGSEPLVPVAAYYKTNSQLAADARARSVNAPPQDARGSAA